jgi:hypothetical protein
MWSTALRSPPWQDAEGIVDRWLGLAVYVTVLRRKLCATREVVLCTPLIFFVAAYL